MIKSAPIPSSSGFLLEPKQLVPLLLHCPKTSVVAPAARVGSSAICCSLRNYEGIPYSGTFASRESEFERIINNPPLIQKTLKEILGYCLRLEGDPCCYCWEAYKELQELEKELPKAEVERLISRADGLSSLIDLLHRCHSDKKASNGSTNALKEERRAAEEPVNKESNKSAKALSEKKRAAKEPLHVPEWLPKSLEEIEEEERARMPDSAYTRLLRTMRVFPSWYVPRPDHETD